MYRFYHNMYIHEIKESKIKGRKKSPRKSRRMLKNVDRFNIEITPTPKWFIGVAMITTVMAIGAIFYIRAMRNRKKKELELKTQNI